MSVTSTSINMKVFFLVILVVYPTSSDQLLIITGSQTPDSLKEALSNFFLINASSLSDFLNIASFSLILDISLDSSTFLAINSLTQEIEVPIFTLTKSLFSDIQPRFIPIFPPSSSEGLALCQMISFFKWQSFSIFLSNSLENIQILGIIKEKFSDFQIKTCIYDPQVSEDSLDMLVKRYLKVTREKNLLVLDQGESLKLLIKLIKKRKINTFGTYFLFSSSSFYSADLEGSVILGQELQQGCNSTEEFLVKVVFDLIGQPKKIILKDLEKKCEKSICFKKFSIFNQINGAKVLVGTVGDTVIIEHKMVFPGNNSEIQAYPLKTELLILIANGTKEPYALPNNNITSDYFKGALYAADQANSDPDFSGFEFKLIPTDCGNFNIDMNWSIPCLSKYIKVNSVAYLTGFWTQTAVYNLFSLRALGKKVPQVSPFAITDILNNKTQYPEFLKLSGRFDEIFQNSVFMFRFYNWLELGILLNENSLNLMLYKQLIRVMSDMKLKFVNPENLRLLPENYTRDDFKKFKHYFEYIRDTKCRILIVLSNEAGLIFEGLYDVGLRYGDVIIIGTVLSTYFLYSRIDDKFMKKSREIFNGALLFNLVEYHGELGKKIESEMKKRYATVINMCLTYDAFLTIANPIKYLIHRGENYEDSISLMNAMRFQKFVGCSGEIFFIPNENSRNSAWLSIVQVILNSTTNQINFVQISAFNKFSTIVTKILNNPVWLGGHNSVPSNFREKSICVYNKSKKHSNHGIMSLHFGSIVLLIIVIVTAYYSEVKFKYSLPVLSEKLHLTLSDILHQSFFIFEFLQILSLEPSNGLFAQSTGGISIKLGFDLIRIFDFRDSNYWKNYKILMSVAGVHSVLIYICILFKSKFQHTSTILKPFKFLSESFLPIIAHLFFMPSSLMLLSIYRCEEGITNKLLDSFFYRDCSQFCYQGTHLLLSAISMFITIFHLASSIYFRALWESTQSDLNIKTKISYISVLSCFQFLLVMVKVNLETYNRILQGCFISGVLFVLILITIKLKPYNYERCYALQVTLLVMCLWVMVLNTIYFVFPFKEQFKISLFCGLAIILIIGLKVSSRCPKRFFSDYSDAVPTLIKFQFSKRLNESITKSKYFKRISKRIEPVVCHQEIFKNN